MLGYYSVTSGMEIHVIDTNPFSLSRGGGLTDVTLVEKYRMDDEAYDKRKGTMRDWIREKRKDDPNYKLKPGKMTTMGGGGGGAEKTGFVDVSAYDKSSVEGIDVGLRAQVMPGSRRGVIKFVGEIEQLKSSGYWVGVQFDEPLGRNDGSIKGVKIFDCPDGYGVFARGNNVTVGDFPEKDLMEESDEEDNDEVIATEEDEDEI
jgi:tubulin-folding cofactor B